jgi:hypothetical protein
LSRPEASLYLFMQIFALDFASEDSELKLAGGAVQAPERFARLAWSAAHPDSATFPVSVETY